MEFNLMKVKSCLLLTFVLIFSITILSCSGKSKIPSSGFLDFVNVKYENGLFYAWGWAADKEAGAPVEKVIVYIDEKWIGDARLGLDRPWVAKETMNPDWLKSGWEISVPISLEKGIHRVYVLSLNKRGEKLRLHHEMDLDVK